MRLIQKKYHSKFNELTQQINNSNQRILIDGIISRVMNKINDKLMYLNILLLIILTYYGNLNYESSNFLY